MKAPSGALSGVLCLTVGLSACTTASIPFDLTQVGPHAAPSGPKVASIVANVKCEMFETTNNTEQMIRYYDDPSLPAHYDPRVPGYKPADEKRLFSLKNLFEEIEYVGEAQLQLDVMGTAGLSPSFSFIDAFQAAGTNLTGTLNLNGSSQAHRYMYLYSSIDIQRLVYSPPFDGIDREGPLALFAPTQDRPKGAEQPSVACGQGTELGGKLGLQEYFSAYFTAADMNDIAVWPAPPSDAKAAKALASASPPVKIPASDAKFTIGQLVMEVEFTVTSGINGGPLWTLADFKGVNSGSGFLNYSRTSKNTLIATFIPVCIRQKYKVLNEGPPYSYKPELVEGTPRWAPYLPPCSKATDEDKSRAYSAAHEYNVFRERGFVP